MSAALSMLRTAVIALLLATAPGWLSAAEEDDPAAAGTAPQTASDGPQVITPARNKSSRAGKDGPAVELITGGNSTDGAARVGSLPVLD